MRETITFPSEIKRLFSFFLSSLSLSTRYLVPVAIPGIEHYDVFPVPICRDTIVPYDNGKYNREDRDLSPFFRFFS